MAAEGRKICTVCCGELDYEVGWGRGMSSYEIMGWQASCFFSPHCHPLLGKSGRREDDECSRHFLGRHVQNTAVWVKLAFVVFIMLGGCAVKSGLALLRGFSYWHSLLFCILYTGPCGNPQVSRWNFLPTGTLLTATYWIMLHNMDTTFYLSVCQ